MAVALGSMMPMLKVPLPAMYPVISSVTQVRLVKAVEEPICPPIAGAVL